MPKIPIDYNNTIVYKLVCKDITITEIYVGHTTNFTKRKSSHKCRCNNLDNPKSHYYVYRYIRDHDGFENWDMVVIKKYKCEDKLEALKHERYHIDKLKATLNKVLPLRTKKEYLEDTKEAKKQYDKEYRKINQVSRSLQKKEYYEKNKERINALRREKYLNSNIAVA